jgi:hypothetical protein
MCCNIDIDILTLYVGLYFQVGVRCIEFNRANFSPIKCFCITKINVKKELKWYKNIKLIVHLSGGRISYFSYIWLLKYMLDIVSKIIYWTVQLFHLRSFFYALRHHNCSNRIIMRDNYKSLCNSYLQQMSWVLPLALLKVCKPEVSQNHLSCFGAMWPKLY